MLEDNKQTEFETIQNEDLNLENKEQVEVPSNEEAQPETNSDSVSIASQEGDSDIGKIEVQEGSVPMTDLIEATENSEVEPSKDKDLTEEGIHEEEQESSSQLTELEFESEVKEDSYDEEDESNEVSMLEVLSEEPTQLTSTNSALGQSRTNEIDPNKVAGKITVLKTVGGSEIVPIHVGIDGSVDMPNNFTEEKEKEKRENKEVKNETPKPVNAVMPQGIAEISFTLSGEVLGITGDMAKRYNCLGKEKLSIVKKDSKQKNESEKLKKCKSPIKEEDDEKYEYKGGNGKSTLGTLIQNAYQETLKDANTGFNGTVTLEERQKLRDTLHEIFKPSKKTGLTFRDDNGEVIKIEFWSADFIPGPKNKPSQDGYYDDANAEIWTNYVRNIIDLKTMNERLGKDGSSARSVDASNIAVKFLVRKTAPDGKNNLKTNTNYTFIGIDGGANLKVAGLKDKDIITGFTVGNFKTGRIASKLNTRVKEELPKIVGENGHEATFLKEPALIDVVFEGKDIVNFNNAYMTDLHLSMVKDKTYIDMKILAEGSHINESGEVVIPEKVTAENISVLENTVKNVTILKDKIEPTGTTIKFKSIVFIDTDRTISKIEIEDDRGTRYKCQLVPKDSSKDNGPAYLEVIELQRGMPYIFRKLVITSKLNDVEDIRTIYFANDYGSSLSEMDKKERGEEKQESKIILNDRPIMTTYFNGPKLELIGDIECGDENHKKNKPHESSIKHVEVEEGLRIPPVKNDRTALMYILKPDITDITIDNLSVIGLGGEEHFKFDTTLDSNGKVKYYTLKLTGLTPDRDYGFLMIELSYKDPQGNSLTTRQSLSDINPQTTCLKADNTTEKTEISGDKAFSVSTKEINTSSDPREIEVPIFLDDMYDNFQGIILYPPEESPNAQAVYEDGKIVFSDLTPNTTGVYKVEFMFTEGNNGGVSTFVRNSTSEVNKTSRYITITTPNVLDLDIKSVVPTVYLTSAEFKFEYYSEPKSSIKTVLVKDSLNNEIKSSFDKSTNILKLEDLKSNTTYSKVKVIFTLENNKIIDYILADFTTKNHEDEKGDEVVVKPTGKVAEFVDKVYKIALGREPEVEGWKFWIEKLESKELSVTEFILGLMKQEEFVNKLISKEQFIKMMYEIIVGREADEDGQRYWEQKYDEYRAQEETTADTRIRIAREMMDTQEFKSYVEILGLRY